VFLAHNTTELRAGDVCFILSFSKILSRQELTLNSYNLVVHASNLPEGKGWSPMTWQILEGKNKVCVSIFEALPKLDSGSVYEQEWIKLKGTELAIEWREKLKASTRNLCLSWFDRYMNGDLRSFKQNGESSFYPKRTSKDSELNVDKTIRDQFNLLRVVDNEKYPAFFWLDGHRYKITIEKF
jgi:methionyl-tRNA formyltransferase